jgi:hypothetical protein
METKRWQMKGVVRWACHAGTRDFCSALAVLVGSVKNIFLLTVQYFNYFVLIAQQAGQAAVLGRLSLTVCVPGYFSKVCFTGSKCELYTM